MTWKFAKKYCCELDYGRNNEELCQSVGCKRKRKCVAALIVNLHANKDEAMYGRRKTTGRESRTYINVVGSESVEEKDFKVMV